MRKSPKPGSIPGLRQADVAFAAPLSGSLKKAVDFRRVGLVAFWDDDASLDRFLNGDRLGEKLSDGWRGDEAEADGQRHRQSQRAPAIVVAYAIFYTLLTWDFVMSVTPEWASSLFGWWFFMGAFLSGVAMTAFLATQLRSKYRLEAYITPQHFWDIGKAAFAFSIFWVYQFWSQYLPIWYANMPEETWWVFLRFEEPWRPLAFTVFTFVFVLPFLAAYFAHRRELRARAWVVTLAPFAVAALVIVAAAATRPEPEGESQPESSFGGAFEPLDAYEEPKSYDHVPASGARSSKWSPVPFGLA